MAKDKQLRDHERRGEDMPREVSERVEVRGMAGRVDGVGSRRGRRREAGSLGDLADKHGLSKSTAWWRVKHGIPLDAPRMTKIEVMDNARRIRDERVKARRVERENVEWLDGKIVARNPVNPFAGWGR